MVEKIGQCRHPAIEGLREEIGALRNKQEPLEKIVENMHRSLKAFRSILSSKQDNDENGKLKQVLLKV